MAYPAFIRQSQIFLVTHTYMSFRLMLHMFFIQDIYAVSHYAFTTLHDILQEGSSLLLQTANTPTHF